MHLGGELVVDSREVVAVLDARRLGRTPDGSALLRQAVGTRSDAFSPRAVVVTAKGLLPVPITAAAVARRIAKAPSGSLATAQRRTAKGRQDVGFHR